MKQFGGLPEKKESFPYLPKGDLVEKGVPFAFPVEDGSKKKKEGSAREGGASFPLNKRRKRRVLPGRKGDQALLRKGDE